MIAVACYSTCSPVVWMQLLSLAVWEVIPKLCLPQVAAVCSLPCSQWSLSSNKQDQASLLCGLFLAENCWLMGFGAASLTVKWNLLVALCSWLPVSMGGFVMHSSMCISQWEVTEWDLVFFGDVLCICKQSNVPKCSGDIRTVLLGQALLDYI